MAYGSSLLIGPIDEFQTEMTEGDAAMIMPTPLQREESRISASIDPCLCRYFGRFYDNIVFDTGLVGYSDTAYNDKLDIVTLQVVPKPKN